MPFAVSITALSLVQAALVALPRRASPGWLSWLRSSWWAVVPPASVALVVLLIGLDGASARGFAYLALFAVPPLAAWALAAFVRGGRPILSAAAVPLFALAWAASGSLLGQGSAMALEALAAVSLGSLIAAFAPARWLRPGIYAMAAVDTCLVAADLLQGPNSVLSAAMPGGGLPRLQSVSFGSAAMGFGDLFAAATLGALLAPNRRIQLKGAGIAAAAALGFNLLFFFFRELPATVPIALTLAMLELGPEKAAERSETPAVASPIGQPDAPVPGASLEPQLTKRSLASEGTP